MIKNIMLKKEIAPKVFIVNNINDIDEIIMLINQKIPVIVNFDNIGNKSAHRLIDFISGYCYAKNGSHQKMDKLIYKFKI